MAVSGIEDMNGELFADGLSGLGDEGGSLESNDGMGNQEEDCGICSENLCNPRILSCLHVYCEACIDKLMVNEGGDTLKFDTTVICPSCKQETKVAGGAASLPSDYVLTNIVDVSATDQSAACTCCKSKERAVARCSDCPHFLCANCKSAHELMRCFEKHRVVALETLRSTCTTGQGAAGRAVHGPVVCPRHAGETVKYYCRGCEAAACGECLAREHEAGAGSHRCERIADAEPALRMELHRLAEATRARAVHTGDAATRLNEALSDLQHQRDDARNDVANAFTAWRAALERCRERALRTLDRLHEERELRVMDLLEAFDKSTQRTMRACEFTARLLQHGDAAEIAALKKTVSSQFLRILEMAPDFDVRFSIEFAADFDNFEEVMQDRFCKFKTELSDDASEVAGIVGGMASMEVGIGGRTTGSAATASSYDDYSLSPVSPLPPVSGVAVTGLGGFTSVSGIQNVSGGQADSNVNNVPVGVPIVSNNALTPMPSIMEYNLQQLASIAEKESHPPPHSSPAPSFTLADFLANDLNSSHAFNNLQALAKLGLNTEVNGCGVAPSGSAVVVAGGQPSSIPPAPFIRATKATPMHIRFKFGQLGSGKGQFNSPHGFCLGNEEDIVVADTNNHRITVFEKTGQYKFNFGVAGKEEGQLWYPRKVAVMRATGKFVVCDRGNERSRMQIFTKNGHFLKKIAVRYIDIVAGLAVTAAGHIVAVDSVTPTVFVISESGDLLSWFDCSECMREPSDIAISGKEFYVCDFKGHCVVVFTEDGKFLRRIGCENVTNFPNGIDVSDAGDVLIGDSHGNKFHVAVFSRDGQLVTEFECPYVKVSRCCGLKITSEGYIVTLAKNNHHVLVLNTLYIV